MKQITITLWSKHSEEIIESILKRHLLNDNFLNEIERVDWYVQEEPKIE